MASGDYDQVCDYVFALAKSSETYMPSNTKVLKVNKMEVAFGIALAHVQTDSAVDLLTGPIYQVGKHRYGRRFNDDIDNYGNRVMLAACQEESRMLGEYDTGATREPPEERLERESDERLQAAFSDVYNAAVAKGISINEMLGEA